MYFRVKGARSRYNKARQGLDRLEDDDRQRREGHGHALIVSVRRNRFAVDAAGVAHIAADLGNQYPQLRLSEGNPPPNSVPFRVLEHLGVRNVVGTIEREVAVR